MTERSITIVALGDSTTAGTPGFKSPVEAPPDGAGDVTSQYSYWLEQAHPEWRVLNRGVNGERSDQIRARFDRDVLGTRGSRGERLVPRAVIVIAGVNDIYQGRSAASVEHELEAIYTAAHSAAVAVVAGSIIPFDTATPEQNARMHEVNDWIRKYAARHPSSIAFVDTRAAVAARGNPNRLVASPDRLHPSAQGYRLMALALEPALAAVVSAARRSFHLDRT